MAYAWATGAFPFPVGSLSERLFADISTALTATGRRGVRRALDSFVSSVKTP